MLLHSAASVHGDNGEVEKKKKYNRKRPTLPNSPRLNSVKLRKRTADGVVKKRDIGLHRLLFLPKGIPDGTELTYFIKQEKVLKGYMQENGIVCSCCETEISPSQFEAHAGMAARRQPYRNICTSNGLTLHVLASSLAKGKHITTGYSDDICAICGNAGDLLLCFDCSQAFHPACLKLEHFPGGEWRCANCVDDCDPGRKAVSGEGSSIARPVARFTRSVKAPEFEIGGCAICRNYDFSSDAFNDRTIIFCDQCEKEFHIGCLRDSGLCDLKETPKDKWLCCDDCNRIHAVLQLSVSIGVQIIPISSSNIIRRKHLEKGLFTDGVIDSVQWQILNGKSHYSEHLPLLSSAAAIFQECFDPIVAKSGCDLIPIMVYGRNFSKQDFGGMYCVVLIVRSVVVSAGLLRIFGRELAELPVVATAKEHQGKGYFQALFACIEMFLHSLNVENLVLPAAEAALSIWTKKFGFAKMKEQQLSNYQKQLELTVFKGTTMLVKKVQQISDKSVHVSDNFSSE